MPRKSVFPWDHFLHSLLIAGAVISVVALLGWLGLGRFQLDQTRRQLAGLAQVLSAEALPHLTPSTLNPAAASAFCLRIEQQTGLRVTLIQPDGAVAGDSRQRTELMENHAQRPEVQAALETAQPHLERRHSPTLAMEMVYLAVPVQTEGRTVGVLRLARPAAELRAELAPLRHGLLLACGLAMLLAAALGYLVNGNFGAQIQQVIDATERYAAGDFSRRFYMQKPRELAVLAGSINRMAQSLDQRLREITQQRNEGEAILTSLREGVLAVDRDERILMLNQAAEKILGVSAASSVGKLVQERLRNVELQRFLTRAMSGEDVPDEESLVHWSGGRLLQAESAPLRDAEGAETGTLIVVSDVTELHRLENLRRDFVANVSHELRTPITSIKGFVETLRDGAIDDPEHAGRFLEIIANHADRLSAIIEDLLALSRIERQQDAQGIERRLIPLADVVEASIQNVSPRAAARGMRIEVDCPPALRLELNQLLIEQAIGNLLENAVKYSPERSLIRVEVLEQLGKDGREVQIRVIDNGPGIEKQHHVRLFERFYRADPARSRDMGGTGLGLAIVKHIAQAHGGIAGVQSEIGKGSTFTITLPAPRKEPSASISKEIAPELT